MSTFKQHFQSLLAYQPWACNRILDGIESIPADKRTGTDYDRLRALEPHNFIALEVWLWRITETTYENPKSWFPPTDSADVRLMLGRILPKWQAYLDKLDDAELSRLFHFKTSDGTPRSAKVHDALIHAFNHATYHRGQAARIIHQLGGVRPSTDYFLFASEKL
jgi:uncharacterized damage-inducible protein DinB